MSLFAHLIQTSGIFLIWLLFAGLYQVSPRRYFNYWLKAWAMLLLAMLSLQVHFRFESQIPFAQYFYFFGEYYFAYYLWLGIASYPNKRLPRWISPYIVLLIIFSCALTIMLLDDSFVERFDIHAFVFSLALIPACIALARLKLQNRLAVSRYFALGSLIVLSILFMGNALDMFTEQRIGYQAHTIYIAYQSVFDVILELMLAFGLIVLAALNVQARLRRSHHLLQKERDKMALLAHKDPLTDCFNRHALNKIANRLNRDSGLLVMIDINNLKIINDQFGHQSGDMAIKKVAITLKDFLRSDDYLFRVGGDEFLLISFGLNRQSGEERMQKIQSALLNSQLDNEHIKVTISWGMEEFNQAVAFEQVMQSADKELYSHKVMNKAII